MVPRTLFSQVEGVAAVLVAKKQISLFQQNRRKLTEPRIDRNMKGCLAISVLNEQGIMLKECQKRKLKGLPQNEMTPLF